VIPRAVQWWLLATAASFVLGFLILRFFPSASSPTWGDGIATDVGMAVAIGVLLGWTRQWLQVLVASVLGSVVIILGLDLLFLAPTPVENTHLGLIGTVLFDAVGIGVALVGLVVLVGVGAVIGAFTRAVASRWVCLLGLGRNLRGCTSRSCVLGLSLPARSNPWTQLRSAPTSC
jgi:hypothetical protein